MNNFRNIISSAREALPAGVRQTPWVGLAHGVELLTTEQQLNQYLAAYGLMHEEKVKMALSALGEAESEFSKATTVVDWGCGQALASCCFFDWLKEKGVGVENIRCVNLIEPSVAALTRGVKHVNIYLGSNRVRKICKYLNDLSAGDIDSDDAGVTIHFFSNVLDIPTVDVERLATYVEGTFHGRQVFCCMGPLNLGASRIEEFATKLGIDKSNILKSCQGRLTNVRGTISLLVFIKDESKSEVIRTEFAPKLRPELMDTIMLQRILRKKEYAPAKETLDRILQFYQMVTELEQCKEPDVKLTTPFPFVEKHDGTLLIDLSTNEEFKESFEKNRNQIKTKWPRDLHLGIDILVDDRAYRFLHYVIPFEDIRQFDVTKSRLEVPLKNFSVSIGVAEALQLDDSRVAEIDCKIHSGLSWGDLSKLIREDVVSGAMLSSPQVQISFSEKSIALAQIYSELRHLDGASIQKNPLLTAFLENAEFENTIDTINPDELIRIVEMDDRQAAAVADALNNRVSVVTGPPGCGKTQLILNLMANALVRGQKVLVSSKNNKAVDNVKDRFAVFDPEGCCLRFTRRDQMNEVTLKPVTALLSRVQNIPYDDAAYIAAIGEYEETCHELRDAESMINEQTQLISLEEERKSLISAAKANLTEIKKTRASLEKKFRIESPAKKLFEASAADVEQSLAKLRKMRNDFQGRYSGIGRIGINLFSKGKLAAAMLNAVEGFPSEVYEYLYRDSKEDLVTSFRNGDDILLFLNSKINALEAAKMAFNDLSDLQEESRNCIAKAEEDLHAKEKCEKEAKARISAIRQKRPDGVIRRCREKLSSTAGGRKLVELALSHYLYTNDSARGINAYKQYLPDNIPWRREDMPDFYKAAERFLDVFRLTTVTSLSVKGAFPMRADLFDMLIIDEASQCDIASALPLILRAKRIVVIGDPKQLRFISRIEPEEERAIKNHLNLSGAVYMQYAARSLWDGCYNWLLSAKGKSCPTVLDRHYRCHSDIIGYSNEMFYKDLAIGGLQVCSGANGKGIKVHGVRWIDVKGKQVRDSLNVNNMEATKAIEVASKLAKTNDQINIGIVTPFSAQAERINALIPSGLRDRVIADTVHKFQGDERDVMIYSLVVTDNSPDSKIRWIDYGVPNLVNVAVTRARSLLCIVGNRDYIRQKSRKELPLGHLVDYVDRLEKGR